MKKINIGDLFEVDLGNNKKRFFQFICLDETQLNSEVIRVFKGLYSENGTINFTEIVNNEIDFYAHTMIKLGIKMKFWQKITNQPIEKDLIVPKFRDSYDYGGLKPTKKSSNWYVWNTGESFIDVGKLNKEQQKYDIGIVINPKGLVSKIKTGEFEFSYPDF